jgi:ribosome biogenesis protein ENP2
MKFERYVDADVVDMQMLGDDYGKLAILQSDRTVLFHAPYGQHTSLRMPTFGRMMAYEPTTCELLVSCSGKAGRNGVDKTLGGGEVYRINLEEGRFSAPLTYSASQSAKSNRGIAPVVGGSCIAVSPAHSLTALGGDDGIVRFWDNRIPQNSAHEELNLSPFCTLDIKSSTAGYGFYDQTTMNENPGEVTSIAFDRSGMNIVAGTRGGNVVLYDIRSSKPLHVKEHQYGMPIHTVRFHSASGTVLSSDKKLVKIWRSKPSALSSTLNMQDGREDDKTSMGSIVTNVEGTSDFNHFIVAGDEKDPTGNQSGLVLCTGAQPKMQAFYCPILGSAPRWCSFLENITEELEEKDLSQISETQDEIYEDYKFLTRSDIERLGIQNLVGTPLLRGQMHGFFINIGLYNRIKDVANPFQYEEYRKKKLKAQLAEKSASRIAPKKANKATVNADLADRLESKAGDKSKTGKMSKTLLQDDRFGSLFNNPDYQIDEDDINFKLRNPSGVQAAKMKKDDDMDSDAEGGGTDSDDGITSGFQRVQDSDDEEEGWGKSDEEDTGSEGEGGYYDSDSEDDGLRGGKVRGENYEDTKAMARSNKKEVQKKKQKKEKKQKKNIMFEADGSLNDGNSAMKIGLGDADAISDVKRKRLEMGMSMKDRLRAKEEEAQIVSEAKTLKVKGKGATKEVSYIPKSAQKKHFEKSKEKTEDVENSTDKRKRKRRGVKELGFKTPFKNKM